MANAMGRRFSAIRLETMPNSRNKARLRRERKDAPVSAIQGRAMHGERVIWKTKDVLVLSGERTSLQRPGVITVSENEKITKARAGLIPWDATIGPCPGVTWEEDKESDREVFREMNAARRAAKKVRSTKARFGKPKGVSAMLPPVIGQIWRDSDWIDWSITEVSEESAFLSTENKRVSQRRIKKSVDDLHSSYKCVSSPKLSEQLGEARNAKKNRYAKKAAFDPKWTPRTRYDEYLCSDEWLAIRWRVLEREYHQCQVCGVDAVEVHHMSYADEVMRGEQLGSLVALCKYHHKLIEFTSGRKNTLNQANSKLLDLISKRSKASRVS